jgi:hypothetical protein
LATLAGTETFTNKTLTAPTFTTPTLGAATSTSINSLTITNAAATLTLAGSSTFSTAASVAHTGAFAQTLAATAATSITLPTAGTLATLAGVETLTNKTFGDTSMNGRLFVAEDASFNTRLYVGSDASFGGKLFVSSDASMNGNLSLAKDLTVTGNLYVNTYSTRQTITTLSYEFFVTQDISATGRLFMGSDASFLGRVNNIVITAPVGISTLTLGPGTTFSTAATVAHTGAFAQTLVGTAATSITLPTTGTLATLAGAETFTNKTLTAPTFTTPTLGAATATSVNSLTITNAAATLTLAASSTFSTAAAVAHTGAFAQTLVGTAATSITLPTTGTLATLAGSETFTNKTLNGSTFFTGTAGTTNLQITTGDASMNGNLSVGSVFKPFIISEYYVTNAGTTSPYTFDFNTGTIFYVTSPPSSNFTSNFTNVPTDINRTFVCTIYIISTTNKVFSNYITITGTSPNNVASAVITPGYGGGIPTITLGNVITQTFAFLKTGAGSYTTVNCSVITSINNYY